MGLDMTHDCWHGPFSAFHRWRREVARLAGFPPLDIMEDFYGELLGLEYEKAHPPRTSGSWEQDGLVMAYWRDGRLPLKWADLGDHVGDQRLIPLLRHSDCDGEIAPDEAATIAAGLQALVDHCQRRRVYAGRPESEPRADYDGFWPATRRFIDGLWRASAANEVVEFR